MYKKKIPVCKLCGKTGHYKYQCFQNPKRSASIKKKYRDAYKTGKTPKHDKVLANQTLDRKRLIMTLDRYCSLVVRLSESDNSGMGTCIACGRKLPYTQLDNGHYVSRQHLQTRWDLDNCHSQCHTCNRLLRGNLPLYRKNLVRKIGEEKVRELETRPPRKISTPELEEMLKQMKLKYKQILEEKTKPVHNLL